MSSASAQLRLSVLDSSEVLCSFQPGQYIFLKLKSEKTVRAGVITDIRETFLVMKDDTLSYLDISHLSPPNLLVAPPYIMSTAWAVVGRIISLGFSSAAFIATISTNTPYYVYTYGLGFAALFVGVGEAIYFTSTRVNTAFFKLASYSRKKVRLAIDPT